MNSILMDIYFQLPNRNELIRVLLLKDYNTRLVIVGVMLLGLAGGIIGTFMLLRKRSLMGDAVSHATLPGIGIAFMIMVAHGGDGKSLPGLLLGALISGIIGMGLILLISRASRLKEDAALGIVLSVFFGIGVSVLGVVQKMSQGSAAGLESFIYGKTASMLTQDAYLIAGTASIIVVLCLFLFKEFTILCFDQDYAGSQGWPIIKLDIGMMLLVVSVTVIGLQTVGLILIIAIMVIPAAAARFWTNSLFKMILIAAAIGAASGLFGAILSALFEKLPAGAIIVLVSAFIFAISLFLGSARGFCIRYFMSWRLEKKVSRQNLLRSMYEGLEKNDKKSLDKESKLRSVQSGISLEYFLSNRSWSMKKLTRLLKKAISEDLVYEGADKKYHFTKDGLSEAKRIVRNHRLWETYLISYADIAPAKVDRDADQIEHVLGQVMVDKLEELLLSNQAALPILPSPHSLDR